MDPQNHKQTFPRWARLDHFTMFVYHNTFSPTGSRWTTLNHWPFLHWESSTAKTLMFGSVGRLGSQVPTPQKLLSSEGLGMPSLATELGNQGGCRACRLMQIASILLFYIHCDRHSYILIPIESYCKTRYCFVMCSYSTTYLFDSSENDDIDRFTLVPIGHLW